ncbi:MAG: hypothetical protein HC888_17545 [Candidatus Competibacteraceae bacterium]|nr:hypothetical protein [Candidatus Competibacteraceae bacterium]
MDLHGRFERRASPVGGKSIGANAVTRPSREPSSPQHPHARHGPRSQSAGERIKGKQKRNTVEMSGAPAAIGATSSPMPWEGEEDASRNHEDHPTLRRRGDAASNPRQSIRRRLTIRQGRFEPKGAVLRNHLQALGPD